MGYGGPGSDSEGMGSDSASDSGPGPGGSGAQSGSDDGGGEGVSSDRFGGSSVGTGTLGGDHQGFGFGVDTSGISGVAGTTSAGQGVQGSEVGLGRDTSVGEGGYGLGYNDVNIGTSAPSQMATLGYSIAAALAMPTLGPAAAMALASKAVRAYGSTQAARDAVTSFGPNTVGNTPGVNAGPSSPAAQDMAGKLGIGMSPDGNGYDVSSLNAEGQQMVSQNPELASFVNSQQRQKDLGSYLSNVDMTDPNAVALAVAQQARADYQPYADIGLAAIPQYNSMIGAPGAAPFSGELSPLAKEQQRIASQTQARADSARGLSGSGGAATRETQTAGNIAAQDYQNQYNRILDALNIGRGATAQSGTAAGGLAGTATNVAQLAQNQQQYTTDNKRADAGNNMQLAIQGLDLYAKADSAGVFDNWF